MSQYRESTWWYQSLKRAGGTKCCDGWRRPFDDRDGDILLCRKAGHRGEWLRNCSGKRIWTQNGALEQTKLLKHFESHMLLTCPRQHWCGKAISQTCTQPYMTLHTHPAWHFVSRLLFGCSVPILFPDDGGKRVPQIPTDLKKYVIRKSWSLYPMWRRNDHWPRPHSECPMKQQPPRILTTLYVGVHTTFRTSCCDWIEQYGSNPLHEIRIFRES